MAKFLKNFAEVCFSLAVCDTYLSRRVGVCSDQRRKWGSGQTTSHMETRGSVSFMLAGWGESAMLGVIHWLPPLTLLSYGRSAVVTPCEPPCASGGAALQWQRSCVYPSEGVRPQVKPLFRVVLFPRSTAPAWLVKEKVGSRLRPRAFKSAGKFFCGFSLAESSAVENVLWMDEMSLSRTG